MKKIFYLLLCMNFLFFTNIFSQPIVKKAVGFRITKPLRDIPGIPVGSVKRPWKQVPNKFDFRPGKGTTLNPSLLEID